ncbi:hypothetical protein EST38_g9457 [Candolleomyces aberdarensis]|uniref:Uncharacterized protein n=1 Tax=Candolleomyces aberdarensis TaxID=2316362 RepID=A0A4Q2DD47_9AGAR|nr:hypothetical protein EST38_g9457 [Candolleomyces aberdarensis]
MADPNLESSETATPKFDPECKFVTSYLVSPTTLAGIRLLLALFTLVTLLFTIIWQEVKTDGAEGYFSYFTNLTFVGLCAYFFASGTQTFAYSRSCNKGGANSDRPTYPLQRWHRVFQYLHVLLYTTIATFPIIVTVVYWALLSSSSSFTPPFNAFSNVSKHALNSVFALFEVLFTNVGPLPWLDLPVTIVLLCGYLGVAYITHATQGFYPYSFLDPKRQGAKLAAYIIGIAVGQVIVFVAAWGIIKLREHLVLSKKKASEASMGAGSEPKVNAPTTVERT